MTCWRCAKEIAEGSIQCPHCGAEKPPVRRARTETVAADAYRARMRETPDDAARVRAKRRRQAQDVQKKVVPPPPAGSPPSKRNASERPERAPKTSLKNPRSMPPRGSADLDRPVYASGAAQADSSAPARMVRHHEYEAIVPRTKGYDQVNWLRLCGFAAGIVILLSICIYFFLANTMPGQRWLAANGREASAEAYHDIGNIYMGNGSISRAVWALEIAQAKDPDNLEILIDLGKAYIGNQNIDRAELAFSRAIEKWPAYPDPYIELIEIKQEQGKKLEAMRLIEMAIAENGSDYFTSLYQQLKPKSPSIRPIATSYFSKAVDVFIEASDGRILYTLDGKDPIESGIEYAYSEDNPILLEKGGWTVRAVVEKEGIYSDESKMVYNVIAVRPDPPSASIGSGKFTYPQGVTLRAGKDVVAIYYTIDGTQPTLESKQYDPENPIQLRIGKTTLRAFAVNSIGEQSIESTYNYVCEGKAKSSMTEKDTIGSLKLFNTTRKQFEAEYGQSLSEEEDKQDSLGIYTLVQYSFGHAVFLDRGGDKEPVLTELRTNSAAFSGPRGTGIGVSMQEVIDAFRDVGGEDNAQGDRLLYNLSGGSQGFLTKVSDRAYKISYYTVLENQHKVELTYYILDGVVAYMEWVQFD